MRTSKPISVNIEQIDYALYDTLFLDRDGVINVLRPGDYVKSWDEFIFREGILEYLAQWNRRFKHIVIVTNQRGVGRGRMSQEDLSAVHDKMLEVITLHGGRIDRIYACTAVEDSDECRKPNIGMALAAKRDFPDIEFSRSLMIGDSPSDELFARQVGMSFFYIE